MKLIAVTLYVLCFNDSGGRAMNSHNDLLKALVNIKLANQTLLVLHLRASVMYIIGRRVSGFR